MIDALPTFLASMAAAGIVPLEPISAALANGELVRLRAQGDMAAVMRQPAVASRRPCRQKDLISVALAMRRAFPAREIVLAADHDGHLPRNIGLEAAQEAAQRVGGVLALPIAAGADRDSASAGIDFADMPGADAGALIELARTGKVTAHE